MSDAEFVVLLPPNNCCCFKVDVRPLKLSDDTLAVTSFVRKHKSELEAPTDVTFQTKAANARRAHATNVHWMNGSPHVRSLTAPSGGEQRSHFTRERCVPFDGPLTSTSQCVPVHSWYAQT